MTTRRLDLIHCITPIHNGSGEGLGVIDRPVIRESTTHYPYIQGSTIKGSLRSALPANFTHKTVTATDIFGPPPEASDGLHRGCASFSDAVLALLPTQSLAGVFAWVTCPLIVARLARWCVLLEDHALKVLADTIATTPIPSRHLLLSGSALLLEQNRTSGPRACLGGTIYKVMPGSNTHEETRRLAEQLAGALFADDPYFASWFVERLAIVHDDAYGMLVRSALPVEANIRIGPNGATEDGSLRYTEFVPADSVFMMCTAIDAPVGHRDGKTTVDDAAMCIDRIFTASRYIQMGADETKGKGLVRFCGLAPPPPDSGAAGSTGGVAHAV